MTSFFLFVSVQVADIFSGGGQRLSPEVVDETRFLAETDWAEYRTGFLIWLDSGKFSEAVLLQAMRSESAQVRANAYIAWESPDAQYKYWSGRGGFKTPQPGEPFLTIEDQEVWKIMTNHLRDDHQRMNRSWEKPILFERFEVARPALELALADADGQLRNDAKRAFLFENFNERFPALNRAILDDFEHYSGNRPRRMYPGGRGFIRMNSTLEQEWLVHHGEHFYDILLEWLLGDDRERCAVAAHVFARRGWIGHEEKVVSVLLDHLSDDDRDGNGFLAAKALFHMGSKILPLLKRITQFEDLQQETFLRLLIWDIEDPPSDMEDLRLRKAKIPSVTLLCTHCFDPILQHLGPSFYVPYNCDLNIDGCPGIYTHQYWELKKSACPCDVHSCEFKIREMKEVKEIAQPDLGSKDARFF